MILPVHNIIAGSSVPTSLNLSVAQAETLTLENCRTLFKLNTVVQEVTLSTQSLPSQ